MEKSIKILGVSLLTVLLSIAACSSQSDSNPSTDEVKTEGPATTNDDKATNNGTADDGTTDESPSDVSEERTDRVLHATLKVLSEDGYTTVDFTNKTATRDGKLMTIEIVETEADFKKGLVREKVDDTQSHTLFVFEFNEDDKLTLYEPAMLESIYTE